MNLHLVDKQYSESEYKQQLNELIGLHPGNPPISLVCETNYYTIIPENLFQSDKATHFLKLHHPSLPENYQVLHTYYKNHQGVLVYAFDKHIFETLQTYRSEISIQHHLHPYLDNCDSVANDKITVYVRNNYCDCMVTQSNKLSLLNSYHYTTDEDIIYHVLNIFHHLNIDHNTAELDMCLYGNQKDNPGKLLSQYVPKINHIQIPTSI